LVVTQDHVQRPRLRTYTLKVMTVVAVIFFPVVLVYQAWGYHVFKKRLSVPKVGGDDTTSASAAAPVAATTAAPASPVETR
jgi:cytochrome d ubiquinol oxidase subunit II